MLAFGNWPWRDRNEEESSARLEALLEANNSEPFDKDEDDEEGEGKTEFEVMLAGYSATELREILSELYFRVDDMLRLSTVLLKRAEELEADNAGRPPGC